MTKRKTYFAIGAFVLLFIVGSLLWAVMHELQEMEQFKRERLGVRLEIQDSENALLFVLLTARYTDGQLIEGLPLSSKSFCLEDPIFTQGPNRPISLYCGTNPDFSRLVIDVSIWSLGSATKGIPDPKLIQNRPPDFHAFFSQPDFTQFPENSEEYLYTPIVRIWRAEGGSFRPVETTVEDGED